MYGAPALIIAGLDECILSTLRTRHDTLHNAWCWDQYLDKMRSDKPDKSGKVEWGRARRWLLAHVQPDGQRGRCQFAATHDHHPAADDLGQGHVRLDAARSPARLDATRPPALPSPPSSGRATKRAREEAASAATEAELQARCARCGVGYTSPRGADERLRATLL